jgi:hypothetical protein
MGYRNSLWPVLACAAFLLRAGAQTETDSVQLVVKSSLSASQSFTGGRDPVVFSPDERFVAMSTAGSVSVFNLALTKER